jgi:two-component system, cell cycle sensor histidine kinase and response regulator CckA
MNVITQFPVSYSYDRDLLFRVLFEGAAIGIAICQLDGRILEVNPAFSLMLGYSPESLTGAYAGELCPESARETGTAMDSATISSEEQWLGELMRGERTSFYIEKHYRRKDGSKFLGHLTVSLGHDDRRQPAFLIAMLTDATERKQIEGHLYEAEKMEVIGRLAGGIAHDFNNLLTGILLYCDLLSVGLENAGFERDGLERRGAENLESEIRQLRQHVEEVRRAGEQGAAMTQQLMAVARKQAAEPRPVRINEIVSSTENLLRRLIGEQVELVLELDAALDPVPNSSAGLVLADPAQLRQILLNLVLNARDAMPKGGRVTVTTRPAQLAGKGSGEVAGNGRPERRGLAVSLLVADNGSGMDAETRARLFEPFFTTKKVGAGTGLGLATVQRIVNEAGGRIMVESDSGTGTLIEVLLPAVGPSAHASTASERVDEVIDQAREGG